jgi:hypothetical protein
MKVTAEREGILFTYLSPLACIDPGGILVQWIGKASEKEVVARFCRHGVVVLISML